MEDKRNACCFVLLLCFSVPVVDYDAVRAELKGAFAAKVDEVRSVLSRLQKAQRAAEQALDMSMICLSLYYRML